MTRFLALCATLALASCAGEPRDLPRPELDCRTGLYQNAASGFVALTPTTAGGYRWRRLNGETGAVPAVNGGASTRGWTEQPDGNVAILGACEDPTLRLGPAGAEQIYTRVPLRITETTFEHDGLTFTGRLIWPVGVERAPLVVHTHGSERWSAVTSSSFPYLLAAQGIGSFVYDKRGTGRSEGEYTQDFHVLASDAVAALNEARRIAGPRFSSEGFMGGSQGGWISPLAASQSDVDFVVALYGMAEGALAEDRGEVILGLQRAGWDESVQAKGAELADAAGVIMASDFRDGYAEFDRLRRLYRDEPWYKDVVGEFTGEILPYPEFALRLVGPTRDIGTSWEYDPMPVLSALDAPQLWLLAADDTEAPPAETIRRLRQLQSEGRPIDLAIYPNADHGMIAIESAADGAKLQTGHVPDYYWTLGDWINARNLDRAIAAGAEVTRPAPETSPR